MGYFIILSERDTSQLTVVKVYIGKHETSLPRTGKYPKEYNIHARGAQIYIV